MTQGNNTVGLGKLTYSKNKFQFFASSANDHALAKKLGLRMHGVNTPVSYYTRNIHKARKLRTLADQSAELKFKNNFFTDYPRPEQVIYPDHLSPKLSQIESVFHCTTRSPAYCADEAGLGKSAVSVMCVNTVPGRTLVICPPYLKYNWKREIEMWVGGLPTNVCVVEGSEDETKMKYRMVNSSFIVLPDSLLSSPKIMAIIREMDFVWCFVDEAHRFTDPKTQRTVALIGTQDGDNNNTNRNGCVTDSCERLVYLSSTPTPNGKPMELFPILNNTAPEVIEHQNRIEFGKKFCAGYQQKIFQGKDRPPKWVWNFDGASKLLIFREQLEKKFMIRHLKCDVLTELAPKERQLIFLNKPEKIHKLEQSVLKNHSLEDLIGQDDFNLGEVSTYKKECGLEKVKFAIPFLKDVITEDKEKLLIFAHHIEVVDRLAKGLAKFKPIVIRGGMSAKEKHKRVDEFQKDKGIRPMIANIDAAGVGLTLTRSRMPIFVEWSWVPGINEQAEDRTHRITQDQDVLARYLVMPGLDERMMHSTLEKEKNNKKMFGKKKEK